MRTTYLLFLSCLLLLGCKKDKPINANAVLSEDKDTIAKEETINPKLEKLAKKLNGLWINNTYLDNIEKTKSICKNRDSYSEMLGFYLSEKSLASGKSEVSGFTEHEGGIAYPIKYNEVINGFIYDSIRKNGYSQEIDFSVNPIKNNKLEINFNKPEKKKELYRKISDSDNVDELSYELNHILFEGTYIDSITQKEFIFYRNGIVKGFDKRTNYELQYDFVVELTPIDFIFLWYGNHEGFSKYHYKIKGDKIRLYNVYDYESDGDEEYIPETYYFIHEQPAFVLIKK